MSSTLHCVTEFDGGRLYHTTHDDNLQLGTAGWFPFALIPSANAFTSNLGLACAASQIGDLHVCAISTTNKLYHTIRFASGDWQSAWGDVQAQESQSLDINIFGSVSCAASPTGDLHVCIIDKAGVLWHTIRFATGVWQSSWGNVQSQESQGPNIQPDSAVSCAVNQSGDLHVSPFGVK